MLLHSCRILTALSDRGTPLIEDEGDGEQEEGEEGEETGGP